MYFCRAIVFVLLALGGLTIPQLSFAKMHLAAQGSQGFMPNQQVKIGNRQAASLVKKRYHSSKVLSINLIQSKGPPVYRVKTLSSNGVVKYVFVDGISGNVFE